MRAHPYRTPDPPPPAPLLCRLGWHFGHLDKPLFGGDGPDEAAAYLECTRCGAWGWRYCDGTKLWRTESR